MRAREAEGLHVAATKIYDTISNMSERERASLKQFLSDMDRLLNRISCGTTKELERTAYQLTVLFAILAGKPDPRYPSELPDPPGRGRKTGSIKDPLSQKFIWKILVITEAHGGKLDVDATEAGTLIEALKALDPYVPCEIDSFSASTLRRHLEILAKITQSNPSDGTRQQI